MGSAVSLKRTVNALSCCGDIPITRHERFLLRLWEARKDFGNGRVVYPMGGGTFCEHFSDMHYREFCDFYQAYQESQEHNHEYKHVAPPADAYPPFRSAQARTKSTDHDLVVHQHRGHEDYRIDYGPPDIFMNSDEELSTANQTPDLPAVTNDYGERSSAEVVHAVGYARPSFETTQEEASVTSADQELEHAEHVDLGEQGSNHQRHELLKMRQDAEPGELWPDVATLPAPTPGPLDKDYYIPTDIGVIQRGAKDLFNRSAWLADSDPHFVEDVFDIAAIVGQRLKEKIATVDPSVYVSPAMVQRILSTPGLGPRIASWGSTPSAFGDQ